MTPLPRRADAGIRGFCAPLALLLALAACDPFAAAQDQRPDLVTPDIRCRQFGGTPATRPAKDGTPWKVCTFPDTRVCDIAKLRVDNRCYTDVPATGMPATGMPAGN